LSSFLSQFPAANASSAREAITLVANDRILIDRGPKSFAAIRPPAFSHLLGGYSGGQAEFLRVPYADVGPIKVPDSLTDDQVLFLSDIFPTGYMAAEFCNIQRGDTIAIWGCGPVGQMAIRSAFLLGAERVIAIDTVRERLEMARFAGAITLDFKNEDIYDRIQDLTQGRGADACIDAVGTEPDTSSGFDAVVDRVKVATFRAQIGRTFCARRFIAAAISEPSRSWASMVASSIKFQWVPRSIADSRFAWLKRRYNVICRF
jgi:threonine dehydrogenase-like Zn-dependent dehydrogenase